MSKQYFINTIKKLDDCYLPAGAPKKHIIADMKINNYKTYKEYFIKKYKFGLSNVDIKIINQLILDDNKTKNPFIIFYELDELSIKKLFDLLSKTQNALRCYDKYAEQKKDLNKKNSKGGIKRDIQKIMTHIENTDSSVMEHIYNEENNIKQNEYYQIPQGYKAYEYLQWMINSLDNIHYTQRQLFENLLYEMNEILVPKKISKKKIYSSVNLLIKHYFEIDNISFSTKQRIDNFTTTNYQYEGIITLTHYKKLNNTPT